ncbi:hypothetical protein [Intestinimonas butyriciproducens]|uniref:hypothetical protein n=1 Tax=Intestinimonas butyriciproducens TaxID=1297617 RepID=UPI001AB0547B|nr:hypothetical protein [Intestinimonas butyriciproducens]MBO3280906.1 hypothetical protein [Intestinimonas butyriciproducens]
MKLWHIWLLGGLILMAILDCDSYTKNVNLESFLPNSEGVLTLDEDQAVFSDESCSQIKCGNGYMSEVSETIWNLGTSKAFEIVLTQGYDQSKYKLLAFQDNNGNVSISISEDGGKGVQVINDILCHTTNPIEFIDVNYDGYADLQLNLGGTLNELHKLFVWTPTLNEFLEVTCDYPLSYFEVYDGYLKNWVKNSSTSTEVQILVWENPHTLSLEYETTIELEDVA